MVSYSFQNVPNNMFCHNYNYYKSIVIVSIFNSQFRVPSYMEHSYSLVSPCVTKLKTIERIVAAVINNRQ